MGTICKNVCESFKGRTIPNKSKYKVGQKRCTFCQIFLDFGGSRCPCCGTILRTRAR